MLKVGGIVYDSIVDGPGLRTTVFFQGCSHNCPGCHNPDLWDEGGVSYSPKMLLDEISRHHLGTGLTLSGGDPLQQNLHELAVFCREFKQHFPGQDIWLYTGYEYDTLNHKLPLFKQIDVIVDGKFVAELKDSDLKSFRGSTNQRIILLEGYER